jgi:hypothetical protein
MTSTGSALRRRRRTPLPASLVSLELFIGIGAIYGSYRLITDSWHLPTRDLAPLPLHSWVLPGLALLVIVAVPMLAAAGLAWRFVVRTANSSITAGVILVGWIVIQVAIVGLQMWLQPVMLVLGAVTAALGWRWRTQQRG